MGWYDSAWTKRVKVTALATKVEADLTDYPVYVDLSDLPADFHTNVKAGGVDIRVTESDGETEVPREVVFYDADTDTGELHFKGDVDSDTNTDFYIYYGNSSASDYAVDATYGTQNVWSNNYVSVHHLQESSLDLLDSTSHSIDMVTASGTPTYGSTGQTIMGKSYYHDGSTECVIANDSADLDASNLTAELWHYTTGTGHGLVTRHIAFGDSSTPYMLLHDWSGTQVYDLRLNTDGVNLSRYLTTIAVPKNQWVYAVMRYDATNHRLSLTLNDTERYNNSTMSGNLTSSDHKYVIGSCLNSVGAAEPSFGHIGYLDEIRISSTPRSDSWLLTSYNNQYSPSTFYEVGTAESNSRTTGPLPMFFRP